MSKRPGEDWFFSGAFCCFLWFSATFRQICLEVLRFFVYLQPTKGVEVMCYPKCLSIKKLQILRNALKHSVLISGLQMTECVKDCPVLTAILRDGYVAY